MGLSSQIRIAHGAKPVTMGRSLVLEASKCVCSRPETCEPSPRNDGCKDVHAIGTGIGPTQGDLAAS